MNMKRIYACAVTVVILVLSLSGCGKTTTQISASNVNDYFNFDYAIVDYDCQEERSLLSNTTNYKANVKLEVTCDQIVTGELNDVSLKLHIKFDDDCVGWASDDPIEADLSIPVSGQLLKYIDISTEITLPNILSLQKPDSCDITIVEASGTITK